MKCTNALTAGALDKDKSTAIITSLELLDSLTLVKLFTASRFAPETLVDGEVGLTWYKSLRRLYLSLCASTLLPTHAMSNSPGEDLLTVVHPSLATALKSSPPKTNGVPLATWIARPVERPSLKLLVPLSRPARFL